MKVSACCKEDFKCTSHLRRGEMRRAMKISVNNYHYHYIDEGKKLNAEFSCNS